MLNGGRRTTSGPREVDNVERYGVFVDTQEWDGEWRERLDATKRMQDAADDERSVNVDDVLWMSRQCSVQV